MTQAGLPCPTNARKQPDPDGVWRCIQHTLEPSVREAIRISRSRGGLSTSGQKPILVTSERFATSESLDALFDDGLSVLKAELHRRKADKARITAAIAQLADAKIRLATLEYTARALSRLRPGVLSEVGS
jgi:hypothetical protein